MKTQHKARLQMLRRVRDFLQPMAGDPALAAPVAELEGVIERLTLQSRRQETHHRQAKHGTQSIETLTRNLRQDLVLPVALLVRTMLPDAVPQVPGTRALSVPRGRDREGLINAAKGLHDVALPHEERLVAAGLPKGHLAQLLAGAEALRAAVDGRAQVLLQRASSGSLAASEVVRATTLVRLIHSLVRPRFRGDPGLTAAWQQARRVVSVSVSAGTPTTEGDASPAERAPGDAGDTIVKAQDLAAQERAA